jgi:hypothetical protein
VAGTLKFPGDRPDKSVTMLKKDELITAIGQLVNYEAGLQP